MKLTQFIYAENTPLGGAQIERKWKWQIPREKKNLVSFVLICELYKHKVA